MSEKLETIIILKKGRKQVKKVKPGDIVNTILSSTNFEFQNTFTRKVFLNYCFHTNFEPHFIERKTRNVLDKATKKVKCYIIYGNKNNFHKTIEGLI